MKMDRIADEIDRCTVLMVVGSSGTVHPAASFVQWANQRGARTVYVGPEQPLNAVMFTQIVLGKAGEVLPGLFSVSQSSERFAKLQSSQITYRVLLAQARTRCQRL